MLWAAGPSAVIAAFVFHEPEDGRRIEDFRGAWNTGCCDEDRGERGAPARLRDVDEGREETRRPSSQFRKRASWTDESVKLCLSTAD
jgi:hypothetical protein